MNRWGKIFDEQPDLTKISKSVKTERKKANEDFHSDFIQVLKNAKSRQVSNLKKNGAYL